MALNIKNPETHRLARELAEITGESVSGAVALAIQERLERLRRERQGRLAERLLEIGRDCAGRLDARTRVIDHGELLYDEQGLPR